MAAVVPIVIPAIVHRQQRIVAALRAAGATDSSRAATIETLAIRDGMALRILRRHEIVRDAGGQLLWLDEAAWHAHEGKRRRFAFRLILGMLFVVAAALFTLWLLEH